MGNVMVFAPASAAEIERRIQEVEVDEAFEGAFETLYDELSEAITPFESGTETQVAQANT